MLIKWGKNVRKCFTKFCSLVNLLKNMFISLFINRSNVIFKSVSIN